MKLQPETLAFLRTLSKQERKEFLDYLRDADENIASEIGHLDNEMGYVHADEPDTKPE